MNPEQRRNLIRRQVRGTAGVTAAQLQEVLRVSAMTVWRDLAILERAGALRRVHGGAVPVDEAAGPEPTFAAKAVRAAVAKQRIARVAVQEFLRPGMVVAMDGGTTVAALMPFLRPDANLSVVTNSLEIVRQIPAGLSVYCSGGMYREVSGTFVGAQALAFFRNTVLTWRLFPAPGLDAEEGLMDPNPLEIEVKRALCRKAGRIILLLDSGKMGVRSALHVLPLDDIDVLITDRAPAKPLAAALLAAGVEVRVARAGDRIR